MRPDTGSYVVGVECGDPRCGRFFVTPRQISPESYGEFEEVESAYRCPFCGTTRRYAKRDHIFLLLDEAA
jgi:rubredoxin